MNILEYGLIGQHIITASRDENVSSDELRKIIKIAMEEMTPLLAFYMGLSMVLGGFEAASKTDDKEEADDIMSKCLRLVRNGGEAAGIYSDEMWEGMTSNDLAKMLVKPEASA